MLNYTNIQLLNYFRKSQHLAFVPQPTASLIFNNIPLITSAIAPQAVSTINSTLAELLRRRQRMNSITRARRSLHKPTAYLWKQKRVRSWLRPRRTNYARLVRHVVIRHTTAVYGRRTRRAARRFKAGGMVVDRPTATLLDANYSLRHRRWHWPRTEEGAHIPRRWPTRRATRRALLKIEQDRRNARRANKKYAPIKKKPDLVLPYLQRRFGFQALQRLLV